MKKAALLHGTDGTPQSAWLPWLKKELEKAGYEVWVPALPNNHTPNRQVYNDFLLGNDWDFTDNIIIGHSSGAVSVLNLLADKRCPKINTAVMVGAWAHMDGTELDFAQFKDTFPPNGFDFTTIINKAKILLFIHGDNDPYCPLEQAKLLAQNTKSDIVIIPNGGHLNRDAGYDEFPELLEILHMRNLL